MKDLYKNKIVSVIIPVYNSGNYIAETIESVLNQTYKDIEIVIVDDCSKDNSREVIESYLKKNKNMVYHIQEKNAGAAVARNMALGLARGRYIAFLDSDDLWYPQKIEKQLDLMKEKNAAICYTAIEMINEKGNLIKGKRNIKDRIDYKFLLKNTMIATSTVIVDRKKIGNFQMPLIRSGQDYATWLQLMRNGINAYGINKVFVKYRVGSNSLSSKKYKSIIQVWNIQIKYERINPILATFNTIYFILNAFKKYFIR